MLHVYLVQSLQRGWHYRTLQPTKRKFSQSNYLSLDQATHLNRLCIVVNVDDPHPLVVQVLRLLREDHVGPAIAQLLLVDVEDPCLDLVLEQKKNLNLNSV